jgi:hypothetical protein
VKLKANEVKKVREELLAKQGGLCAMCLMPLDPADAVLDHDHKTGFVRGTCHRSCNSLEGVIVLRAQRYGVASLASLLSSLVAYHELHAEPQTPWIYPSHKTEDEKKALAKKRRARKRKLNT